MNISNGVKIIGLVCLVVMGNVLFSPNITSARIVRGELSFDVIVSKVESYIIRKDYQEAEKLITEYFPTQLRVLIDALYRDDVEKVEEEIVDLIQDERRSTLDKMISVLLISGEECTERGGILPLEPKLEHARFGYLCSLLFVAELWNGNISDETIDKFLPDFYLYVYFISQAYSMQGYSVESTEVFKYKLKTQELLTEHLQNYLASKVGKEIFEVGNVASRLNGSELREYVFYQTIATSILHAKKFFVPPFSERINVQENPEGVNIVFHTLLGGENLAVFREGSKYIEANFIIVPYIDWLTAADDRLLVEKGYVYTQKGLFFMNFKKPLTIHYSYNQLEDNFLKSIVDQGILKFNIPTAGSQYVSDLTLNKGISLELLSKAGINVPRGGYIERAGPFIIDKYVIMEQIKRFMDSNNINEIVIKPLNANCGVDINYFTREQISEAVEYIIKIGNKYNGVKYEERIYPPKIEVDGELHDWNLRVFLSRDENDEWIVSDIAVRYGNGVVNISQGADTMTWERLASLLNITESKARALRKKVETMSIEACMVIEEQARVNAGGHERIYHDFMSTDVIVSMDFVPYIMELNDHTSGAMWDLDNAGGEIGRSSRDWVLTMIRRAKEYREQLSE